MVNSNMQFLKNKTIKISILISSITFFVSVIFGYLIKFNFEKTEYYPDFKEIFINNTLISIIFICGILSLGLVSVGLLAFNGAYFGAALQYEINNRGILYTIRSILPHAIFEIPSMILSSSIGFLLLVFLIKKAHSREENSFKYYIKYIGICSILIIIINVIAAVIEVNISM